MPDIAQRWTWERSLRHSHCGNCIANCGYHLYTTDGEAVFQEVSGDMPALAGVPDYNPLGCQKGTVWHTHRDTGDRVTHPLRRVGERGGGQWERITWDEALGAVADAIIDAHEEEGATSVMIDEGPQGGRSRRWVGHGSRRRSAPSPSTATRRSATSTSGTTSPSVGSSAGRPPTTRSAPT